MEKKHLNLYIDGQLINLARLENINISEVVNTLLESYLDTNGMEKLNTQIEETELKLSALKKRKADLIKQGLHEERQENMNENILTELKEVYKKRRQQQGYNQYADEIWITAPKNIQKAKLLGKQALELLIELQEWYKNEN